MSIYDDVKQGMRPMDLLLWGSSKSLISRLIEAKTKSIYSHASAVMCFPEYEGGEYRRWTTEALKNGTVLNLLSARLENYEGYVDWYPLKPEWEGRRIEAAIRSLDMIGRPYDYKGLFECLLRHISEGTRRMICSGYYFLSFGLSGPIPYPGDLPKLRMHQEPIRILEEKR